MIDEAVILQAIPCGVLVTDDDYRIVFANERLAALTGYSAAQLVGRDLHAVGLGDGVSHAPVSGREWWQWAEGTTLAMRCSIRGSGGNGIPVFVSGSRKDGLLYLCVLDLSVIDAGALSAPDDSPRVRNRFHALVGKSERMQELYHLIAMASGTGVNVVIQGESGTGKELAAAAIHAESRRNGSPFVKVNCASLAPTLLESELFGHVKGAFSGAYRDRQGTFEAAHNGTVLLDEIGEIGPDMQVKLLRVLQERTIVRVGDNREIPVDVRIIAATNRDLRALVQKGAYREDLFYRLNVFPVHIPPLRERTGDIPLLLAHFMEKYRRETGKRILSVSAEAMRLLMGYCWPGNVRELENAVEHAFVLCRTEEIAVVDFPYELRVTAVREGICAQRTAGIGPRSGAMAASVRRAGGRLNITRAELAAELKRHDNNKAATARALGISYVGLWKKMKKLDME